MTGRAVQGGREGEEEEEVRETGNTLLGFSNCVGVRVMVVGLRLWRSGGGLVVVVKGRWWSC